MPINIGYIVTTVIEVAVVVLNVELLLLNVVFNFNASGNGSGDVFTSVCDVVFDHWCDFVVLGCAANVSQGGDVIVVFGRDVVVSLS